VPGDREGLVEGEESCDQPDHKDVIGDREESHARNHDGSPMESLDPARIKGFEDGPGQRFGGGSIRNDTCLEGTKGEGPPFGRHLQKAIEGTQIPSPLRNFASRPALQREVSGPLPEAPSLPSGP